jgi:hypothetical protein
VCRRSVERLGSRCAWVSLFPTGQPGMLLLQREKSLYSVADFFRGCTLASVGHSVLHGEHMPCVKCELRCGGTPHRPPPSTQSTRHTTVIKEQIDAGWAILLIGIPLPGRCTRRRRVEAWKLSSSPSLLWGTSVPNPHPTVTGPNHPTYQIS